MNRLSNIFKFSTWWRIALKPCKRCPVSINNPFGAFPCSENSSSWAHPQGAMWWQRLFSMDIPALSSTVPCWNSLQGTVITWVLVSSILQESSVRAHSAHQMSSHFLQGDKKGFFVPLSLWLGWNYPVKYLQRWILIHQRGKDLFTVLDFVPCFSLHCRAKEHYHTLAKLWNFLFWLEL